HRAGAGHDLARGDRERRRLAGTVRTEQGEHLSRTDLEVDAVEHVDAPVARAHRGQLQDRRDRLVAEHGNGFGRHDASFAVPRYARCTEGSAWISVGVPRAMTRPKSRTLM